VIIENKKIEEKNENEIITNNIISIIDENLIENEHSIKENKKMTIREELEYRYQLVKSFTKKK
jgi:hypothetical protein